MRQQRVLILGNTANPSLNFTWKQHKKVRLSLLFAKSEFWKFWHFRFGKHMSLTATNWNKFVFTENKVIFTVLQHVTDLQQRKQPPA